MFQLAHGAAVRVLEHPEHAFHAGADAVADGFGRDDVDELRAHVVGLLLPAPGIVVFISSLSSPMSSSMPGMRYAWIVFQCLPSLYGGISEMSGRLLCDFMLTV